MRGQNTLIRAARRAQPVRRPALARRSIQISATPTIDSPIIGPDAISGALDASSDSAGMYEKVSWQKSTKSSVDARFEVLGAPYSLLSVSLSASQKLYTRRGTLVGVSGKAENVSRHLTTSIANY